MDSKLVELTKDVLTHLFPNLVHLVDKLQLECRAQNYDNYVVNINLPTIQMRPQLIFCWKRISPGPEIVVFWEAEVKCC